MSQSQMKLVMFLMALVLSFTPSCKHTKMIYLVPIGRLAAVPVDELKVYYRDRFGISVEALSSLPFDKATYDPDRHQLIAEELIAQIKRGYPKQSQDENVILIGALDSFEEALQ